MNTKILQDLQICVSVPFFKCLNILEKKLMEKRQKEKTRKLTRARARRKKLTVDRT